MVLIVNMIHWIFQLLTILLIVQAILSYFMSPYEPIRQTIDRFLNPMLNPIRRIVPPVGMFDFSPLILIVIIQLVDGFLRNILLSL